MIMYEVCREREGEVMPVTTAHRRRLDAARLALRKAVYAAFEANGRLDSLAAHSAMRTAETWDGSDPVYIKEGNSVVVATSTRRHK